MDQATGFESEPRWESPVAANAGAPGAERRQSPRFTVLVRTAKVICASGEFFCIIRDASAEGVRIKVFHPLPQGDRSELVLADGERHTIHKVWEDGDHAGFRFATPIDIERLVTGSPTHLRKREVSLACTIPALLTARSGECEVLLCGVSQFGARIKCGLHLAMRERVRLESDKLGALTATVRSRGGQLHDLVFDRPFAFDELARLCGVLAPEPTEGAGWQHLFAADRHARAQPSIAASQGRS
jgi:hypothetical protein